MRSLYILLFGFFFFAKTSFAINIDPKLEALNTQLKTEKDKYKRIKVYQNLLLLNKSDTLDLLKYKQKIEAYAQEFDSLHWTAEASYLYGRAILNKTHNDSVKKLYQKCLDIGRQIKNDTLIAKGNFGIGFIYFKQDKFDLCDTYINKALSKMQAYDQSRLKAEILNLKAVSAYKQGDIVGFAKYEYESQMSISKIGWEVHEIKINNNFAATYVNQGNYAAALDRLFKALELCEKNGTINAIPILHNIGRLFVTQQNYKSAIKYYKKVLRVAKKDDTKSIMFAKIDLGNVYNIINKPEKAKVEFDYVYTLAKKLNNIDYLTMSSINLAIINFKLGDSSYKNYYDLAKKHVNSLKNIHFKSNTYHLLGKFYFLKKAYNKSINNLRQALRLCYEVNDYSKVNIVLEDLSQSYEKTGNYKKAFHYSQNYIEINDSLKKASFIADMATKSLEYDFNKEKQVLENKVLSEQIKSEQKLKQHKIITYFILAILIFILGIVFYVYKLYRKKRVLSLRLIAQKKQLAHLNGTKDKIFSVIGHDLRTPLSLLSFLTNLVNADDINLKDIKKSFVSINTLTNGLQTSLENLFHWGQSQMNGNNISIADVNVLDVFQKIKPVLEIQLKNKLITLECNIHPKCYVKSDSNQLQIVLRNILSNAIKFSPKNSTITLSCKILDQGNQITIADQGIGMDDVTKTTIFNSEANTSKNGTEGETGTGLGLMLCKEFVEKNKGKIWAESELNQGTKIHVILPAA